MLKIFQVQQTSAQDRQHTDGLIRHRRRCYGITLAGGSKDRARTTLSNPDRSYPMQRLELAIPPLALTMGLALAITAIGYALPGASIPLPVFKEWIGPALAVLGLAVCISGVIAFRKAGTTVDPLNPDGASRIVDAGIYNVSRNPMYLGFLLVLIGIAVWSANWLGMTLALAFVPYMNRFQIGPEERILSEKFGTPYRTYLTRVRRWI